MVTIARSNPGEERGQTSVVVTEPVPSVQRSLGGAQEPAEDPDGNQQSQNRQGEFRECDCQRDPRAGCDRPSQIRRVRIYIDTAGKKISVRAEDACDQREQQREQNIAGFQLHDVAPGGPGHRQRHRSKQENGQNVQPTADERDDKELDGDHDY
jgi:hypothetical protein